MHLFESGSAGRLSAAVAEQTADLYKQAVMAQHARESVATGSLRQLVWKKVTELLGSLPASERDTDIVGNVLTALFVAKDLTDVESPTRVLEAWDDALSTLSWRRIGGIITRSWSRCISPTKRCGNPDSGGEGDNEMRHLQAF